MRENRLADELRPISIDTSFNRYAEEKPLHWDQFMQLKLLADKGISDLATHQMNAIKTA